MNSDPLIGLTVIVAITLVMVVAARAYGRNLTAEKTRKIEKFTKIMLFLGPIGFIASLAALMIRLFVE